MPRHNSDLNPQPQGFILHHSIVINGGDADRVELYLPTLIKFEIDRQKKLEREQRIAAQRERELQEQKEREERKRLRDVSIPATDLVVNAVSTSESSTAQAGADRETRKRNEALGKKMLDAGMRQASTPTRL